jgi:alkanesulfonate monooxygenase SsuD/methylene tetrahydromethanopterin reductase-like flavin-dependent oxidoreductase (luciferase family)
VVGGVNLVAGWNEGEFEMFGVTQREHDARYDFAQEWLDVVKRAWSVEGEFDFARRFLGQGVRAYPGVFGGTRRSCECRLLAGGQAFALRNRRVLRGDGPRTRLRNAEKVARLAAREFAQIEVYTSSGR